MDMCMYYVYMYVQAVGRCMNVRMDGWTVGRVDR